MSASRSGAASSGAAQLREQHAQAIVDAVHEAGVRANDMAHAVVALADDVTPSSFGFLAKVGKPRSAGMTTAHLGDYLQKHGRTGAKRRVDREYVRDYVVKSLSEAGIVDLGLADSKTGDVIRGVHNPKSGNNCYLLTPAVRDLVDSGADFKVKLEEWANDPQRKPLAHDRRLQAQVEGVANSTHAQMIEKTIQLLMQDGGPLSHCEVVYKDVGDNERVPARLKARMEELGIRLTLASQFPDLILYDPRAQGFRLFEAVKSDGEMSPDRVAKLKASWQSAGLKILDFTTVYPDWHTAARRQTKERNLAPGSKLLILEDPSRIFSVEQMSELS